MTDRKCSKCKRDYFITVQDADGTKHDLCFVHWDEYNGTNWHKHTCGECGYFWLTTENTEDGVNMLDECDCMKWKHNAMPHHLACPDFVPREVPE